jgi:multidrug resistance efflux pump
MSSLYERMTDRLEDFPGGALNFGIWLAAAAAVVAILGTRAARVEYVGIARAVEHEISSPTPGTLARVLVDLYQEVEQGDLVAVLDDAEVAAELEVAAAELRTLESQLADAGSGVVAGTAVDWQSERRRFEVDVEERRLEELRLKVEIESDRVEKQRLELKLARLQPLRDSGAIALDDYDDARFALQKVATRLDENLLLLARTREELDAALRRRDAFVGRSKGSEEGSGSGYLAAVRAAIDAQAARVAAAHARRAALTLTAPVSGTVTLIGGRAGQAVVAGEPIVVVARPSEGDVVAWLPERDGRHLEVGQRVWLRSANRDVALSESYILRVAPTVAMLPERLWQRRDMPEYGRAVMVASVEGLSLLPGETVRIRFVD